MTAWFLITAIRQNKTQRAWLASFILGNQIASFITFTHTIQGKCLSTLQRWVWASLSRTFHQMALCSFLFNTGRWSFLLFPSFQKPAPEAQPQHSSSPARRKPKLKTTLSLMMLIIQQSFFLTDFGAGLEPDSEYQRMLGQQGLWREGSSATHFTDEATKAQRGKESCPVSHSKAAAEHGEAPQPQDWISHPVLSPVLMARRLECMEYLGQASAASAHALALGSTAVGCTEEPSPLGLLQGQMAELVRVTLLCNHFLPLGPFAFQVTDSQACSQEFCTRPAFPRQDSGSGKTSSSSFSSPEFQEKWALSDWQLILCDSCG